MKKLLIIAAVILGIYACTEENEIEEQLVQYSEVSAQPYVDIEKSAELFETVYSPFAVTVHYTNIETGDFYDIKVNADSTFFEYGTPNLKLPYGIYEVNVDASGQWNFDKNWSSWYEYLITDTVIEVYAERVKIKFNIAEESAFIVRNTASNHYKGIDMEQRVTITRLNHNPTEVQWTEKQEDVFANLKAGLYLIEFNDTYGHYQAITLLIKGGERYQINLPEKADRHMCDEFTITKL